MGKRFGKNMDIPKTKGDRRLVWGDCFNDNEVDLEIWNTISWNIKDIIQEHCDKSHFLEDGQLTLISSKMKAEDVVDGKYYRTPSFLTTKGRMEFRYGYFEIRAQIPFYKGNSTGFWFCSSEKTELGYKSEIDLVELLGRDDNVVANLHAWGPNHSSNDGKIKREQRSHTFDSTPEKLRTETHTYFMDWNPEYIDFGVDGEVYYHADITAAARNNFSRELDLEAFRLPIFFILSEYLYTPERKLSCSLKGDEEPFEYVLKVDHVALYQKDGEDIYFK